MQINNHYTISFSARGPLSPETKAKISKALTGIKRSLETRKKNAQARLGKKTSDEAKAKISKALTGIKRSAQTREKNAQARLGQKASAKTKAKLSVTMKKVRAQKPDSYGIHSEKMKSSWAKLPEVRNKMSEFFTENNQRTMREFREAYKSLSRMQGEELSRVYKELPPKIDIEV